MAAKPKSKLRTLPVTNKPLGKRLAEARKSRGLTQVELAEKTGLLQNIVSAYETGKVRLTAEMAIHFAKVLSMSVDDLLGVKDGNSRPFKPSLKIVRRMRKIESLPRPHQTFVLKAIDALLKDSEK